MSLVPCRACEHLVDTSALACPQCGATDPGCKISRQQRDRRRLVVQIVVGVALDTVAQIEAHLITRNYEGLSGGGGRATRVRGRRDVTT